MYLSRESLMLQYRVHESHGYTAMSQGKAVHEYVTIKEGSVALEQNVSSGTLQFMQVK